MGDGSVTASTSWARASEEVFYCLPESQFIDSAAVLWIKNLARHSRRGRARVCLHTSPDLLLHHMLIVHPKDAYVRPHSHPHRDETFQILEGRATLFLFDSNGGLKLAQPMGEPGTDRPFVTLIPKGQFHTIQIETDQLVFLESTTGPFHSDGSVEAEWSPVSTLVTEGRIYVRSLMGNVNE